MHKHVAKWRGKGFPLYDDIAELVEGRQATGKDTYRVPAVPVPDQDPNTPSTLAKTSEQEVLPLDDEPFQFTYVSAFYY